MISGAIHCSLGSASDQNSTRIEYIGTYDLCAVNIFLLDEQTIRCPRANQDFWRMVTSVVCYNVDVQLRQP